MDWAKATIVAAKVKRKDSRKTLVSNYKELEYVFFTAHLKFLTFDFFSENSFCKLGVFKK